jgi:uncharacterized lipoprotein YehR (DUF1307 family)
MDRTNQFFVKLLGLVIAFLIALILVFSNVGCTTSRKANKYMVKHPAVGSNFCAVNWPCKDSVKEVTRYLQGEEVVTTHDSLIYLTDTVNNTIEKVRVKYVTTVKVRVDTVYNDRIVYQTDKAKIAAITAGLSQSKQQTVNAQAVGIKYRKWLIEACLSLFVLLVICGVYLYYKFKP